MKLYGNIFLDRKTEKAKRIAKRDEKKKANEFVGPKKRRK